jgi:hypothetical protein
MLRRIQVTLAVRQPVPDFKGYMRVNSSALRKRELGKTLDSSLESSEFPLPAVPGTDVLAAAMLSDPPPLRPPVRRSRKCIATLMC